MMSKARFTEGEYYVQYRDFKELIQLPVAEFWKIAEIVPSHRIARIIEVKMLEETGRTLVPIYESADSNLLALPVRIETVVDDETLRFVSMRDALNQKTPWHRYVELERIKRLEEEGRELLGEFIYVFEKRDGENVSIWLEGTDDPNIMLPHVSSHNMVNADPNIVSRLQATPEWEKLCLLLRTEFANFNKHFILFGELVNKGKGATRIEPTHKYAHWYMFDILDADADTYLPYPLVHQMAYHYRLPCIEAFETWTPWKMDDIEPKVKEWKTWAKRHRREGVVGKVYKNGKFIGFKEKIDLPDLPPVPRAIAEKATFPPMPEDRILRALQHAWDDLDTIRTTENFAYIQSSDKPKEMPWAEDHMRQLWKRKDLAMPLIAKQISVEAREHNFNPPKNVFEIYLNTPIEKIREHPVESV